MKTRTTKRLIGGILTIGMIGLLRSQPLFALPVSQAQPNASQDYVLPYQGSWTGTFRTVRSQGQILVFIDPAGKLYGSLKSFNPYPLTFSQNQILSSKCLTE